MNATAGLTGEDFRSKTSLTQVRKRLKPYAGMHVILTYPMNGNGASWCEGTLIEENDKSFSILRYDSSGEIDSVYKNRDIEIANMVPLTPEGQAMKGPEYTSVFLSVCDPDEIRI